jgi:ribosome maturation factor RimP
MTIDLEHVRTLAEPLLAPLGLEVYDVHLTGTGGAPTLQVLVDREGGVDLDTLTAATQALSPALDAAGAVAGPYLLEVSSPGVERPLRTARHFARAIGETVSVKYRADDGAARVRGTLVAATGNSVSVLEEGAAEPVTVPLELVAKARTVFEWGPAPKPGSGSRPGRRRARADARTSKENVGS